MPAKLNIINENSGKTSSVDTAAPGHDSNRIEEEDNTGLSRGSRMDKKTFSSLEARIIDKFFMQGKHMVALADVANLTREPKDGVPLQSLTVKYVQEKANAVDFILDQLQDKMNALTKEELQFDKGSKDEVADFVEQERDTKVLVYVDDRCRTVHIVGEDYQQIQGCLHKLKVHLGMVKTTGRGIHRQLSDPADVTGTKRSDFSKSYHGQTGKSNIYPDLTDAKNASYRESESTSSGKYPGGATGGSYAGSGQGNGDFHFERTLNNGFVLKVYKASITNLKVDTIVNAANDTLMHGGGVARVIAVAAGYDLERGSRDYIQNHGYLKVARNCITSPGKLPYRSVIHAVGPQWHDYKDKVECCDVLYETIMNILRTCASNYYYSVGMSAISAGIYGVPKELCADMYVKAAVDYSQLYRKNPKELHIIDIDVQILKHVEVAFREWERNQSSIDQKEAVPRYLRIHPEARGGGWSSGGQGVGRGHRGQRQIDHGGNSSVGRGQRQIDHGGNSSVGRGQRQIDHGGNGTGRGSGGKDNTYQNETMTVACAVKSQSQEHYHWGGKADVFRVDGKVTVKIFNGSVDKVTKVDAIVCGTDKTLQARGFIAEALKISGGEPYKKSLQKMQKYANSPHTNSVFKCQGGNLNVQHVIHIVVDRVIEADEKELAVYEEAIFQILKHAKKWNLKKLAIPLIGTGNIQTNDRKLKLCCQVFVSAICKFCSKTHPVIEELLLVNNKDNVCQTFVQVFSKASGDHGTYDKPSNYGHRQNIGNSPEHSTSNSNSGGGRRSKGKTFTAQGEEDMEVDETSGEDGPPCGRGRGDDKLPGQGMSGSYRERQNSFSSDDGSADHNQKQTALPKKGNLLIITDS